MRAFVINVLAVVAFLGANVAAKIVIGISARVIGLRAQIAKAVIVLILVPTGICCGLVATVIVGLAAAIAQ
jgi:hypothetical protein